MSDQVLKLRDLRKRAELTQGALAERMGIASTSAISSFENVAVGKTLRLSTIEAYVAALGGEVAVFAFFDDEIVKLDL